MHSQYDLPTLSGRDLRPPTPQRPDPAPKIQLLTRRGSQDAYQQFAGLIAAGRSGLFLTGHSRQVAVRKLPLDNVRLHFLREGKQLLPGEEILHLLSSFMDHTPRSAILFDGLDLLARARGLDAVRSIIVKLWTTTLFHDTRILVHTEVNQLAEHAGSLVQRFSNQAAAARRSLQRHVDASDAVVRLWLEHAHDVVLLLDLDGQIVYVNRRTEDLSGRPREYWLSQHFSALVHPEDLPIAMRGLHRSLLGNREPVDVRFHAPGGGEVQLSLSANPIYEDGMLSGLLCIGHDMSRWHEAQDRLRHRSEQLSTLYGISTALNQSLQLDRVLSECLLRILALMRMDAAKIRLWDHRTGQPGVLRASVGFEDPEREPFEIHEEASSGQLVVDSPGAQHHGFVVSVYLDEGDTEEDEQFRLTSYHYLALRAKGRTIGVLTLAARAAIRLRPDEENFLQSIATQVAIAIENAHLFEELRRKTEEVAGKNSELEDFVRIASHDLRSPLISVQGFVEAYLDEFGETIPPKGREFLQRALRNTVQMQELISRLQELTQAAYPVHEQESVDLNLLVREIATVLEAKARPRQVAFDIQRLPTVSGDPVRLRQLFLNLIDNAVKYSPGHRPTKVKIRHKNGVFSIRDQGCGIPEEKTDLVFRPMVRLTRDAEGIGMGLAIVKRVIDSLGGRIWVKSKLGSGTTFFFSLEPNSSAPSPQEPSAAEFC